MGAPATPGYGWATAELDVLWEHRNAYLDTPVEDRGRVAEEIRAKLHAVRPLVEPRSNDSIRHAIYQLTGSLANTPRRIREYRARREGQAPASAPAHDELESLVLDMIDELAGQAEAVASLQAEITSLKGEVERLRKTRSMSLLERAAALSNGHGAS